MGHDPKGFDTETLPHASRIPGAPKIVRPRVLVVWNDASGAHEARIEKSALIGSSPSVSLRIDDPLVSRLHAELTVQADGLWLRDLASKNGSFVESVRVVEAQVPNGGRIRLKRCLRASQRIPCSHSHRINFESLKIGLNCQSQLLGGMVAVA